MKHFVILVMLFISGAAITVTQTEAPLTKAVEVGRDNTEKDYGSILAEYEQSLHVEERKLDEQIETYAQGERLERARAAELEQAVKEAERALQVLEKTNTAYRQKVQLLEEELARQEVVRDTVAEHSKKRKRIIDYLRRRNEN